MSVSTQVLVKALMLVLAQVRRLQVAECITEVLGFGVAHSTGEGEGEGGGLFL